MDCFACLSFLTTPSSGGHQLPVAKCAGVKQKTPKLQIKAYINRSFISCGLISFFPSLFVLHLGSSNVIVDPMSLCIHSLPLVFVHVIVCLAIIPIMLRNARLAADRRRLAQAELGSGWLGRLDLCTLLGVLGRVIGIITIGARVGHL